MWLIFYFQEHLFSLGRWKTELQDMYKVMFWATRGTEFLNPSSNQLIQFSLYGTGQRMFSTVYAELVYITLWFWYFSYLVLIWLYLTPSNLWAPCFLPLGCVCAPQSLSHLRGMRMASSNHWHSLSTSTCSAAKDGRPQKITPASGEPRCVLYTCVLCRCYLIISRGYLWVLRVW